MAEYVPRFDQEFKARDMQTYTTDLARSAARGEWARRTMDGVKATPNEHANAIADEVLRVVALRVWEMAYAVGVEDQANHPGRPEDGPYTEYAERQNPFADIGWIKTLKGSNRAAT